MSRPFFFVEPVDAQWKRECEQKNKQWENNWDRRKRQDAIKFVVESGLMEIDNLQDEDIDKICSTLKSLKHNL